MKKMSIGIAALALLVAAAAPASAREVRRLRAAALGLIIKPRRQARAGNISGSVFPPGKSLRAKAVTP
jgi:hypothetical protein